MPFAIRIEGLKEARALLGADFEGAIAAATQAIALDVQGRIAPYPPATEANSPGNPSGRWYERGYGPRWLRKDGGTGGRKTSQMLGRRWLNRKAGRMSQVVANSATYARWIHAAEDQARWASARGWVTDKTAVEEAIRSGMVRRAVLASLRGVMRRG